MSVIDTNVLVHASIAASPEHRRARTALARLGLQGPLAVTRQILREYIAVTTRLQPWSRALTLAEATADTDRFVSRFAVLEDGPTVWDELMTLTRRFAFGGRRFAFGGRRFDSLIEILAP